MADKADQTMNKLEEIVQLLMNQNNEKGMNKIEEIVQLLMHQNELISEQTKVQKKLIEAISDKEKCSG